MSGWKTKLPWLAAIGFLGAGLLWMGGDRKAGPERFPDYSVHNRSDMGLSLAWAYLEERPGTEVSVLARPVSLADLPSDAVLFRIGPASRELEFRSLTRDKTDDSGEESSHSGPSALLSDSERQWLRDGGRLVLAVDQLYGPLTTAPALSGARATKVFPCWPEVQTIDPDAVSAFVGPLPAPAYSIFASGERPVIGRLPIGKGELFLLSSPEMFTNGHLAQADHLPLLERLAATGRPIFLDEYSHGLDRPLGATELLKRFGLGPMLVLAALGAGATFWRRRVRIGPQEDDHEETRTEAVDFVDSVAHLYRRALTRCETIALYRKSLAQAVARQTGLRGNDLEARVLALTGGLAEPKPDGRKDLSKHEFGRMLTALNDAFGRLEDVQRS